MRVIDRFLLTYCFIFLYNLRPIDPFNVCVRKYSQIYVPSRQKARSNIGCQDNHCLVNFCV